MQEDTQAKRRQLSTREKLARCLPGIVAFLCFLLLFDDEPFPARLLTAAFGGLVFRVLGLFVYFFAVYAVTKVAGHELDVDKHASQDMRLTAAVLIFVCVYANGMRTTERRAQVILRCVREQERARSEYDQRRVSDLVHWCAYEYERGDSNSD